MGCIALSACQNSGLTIMIFAEGTILEPRTIFGLYSVKSYVPIGGCVALIAKWHIEGERIVYCTSRRGK